MSDFKFTFPATRWSLITPTVVSMRRQAEKMMEEAKEAFDSIDDYDYDLQAAAVEFMDTIIASETGLRMLKTAGADLEAANVEVIAKNSERGYWRRHDFDEIEVTP